MGSEWTTPTIRKRIEKFIAGGGHVFANADSLSLDIPTGKRTDFLATTFGVTVDHKDKVPFLSVGRRRRKRKPGRPRSRTTRR